MVNILSASRPSSFPLWKIHFRPVSNLKLSYLYSFFLNIISYRVFGNLTSCIPIPLTSQSLHILFSLMQCPPWKNKKIIKWKIKNRVPMDVWEEFWWESMGRWYQKPEALNKTSNSLSVVFVLLVHLYGFSSL